MRLPCHAGRQFAHVGGDNAECMILREVGVVVDLAVDQLIGGA